MYTFFLAKVCRNLRRRCAQPDVDVADAGMPHISRANLQTTLSTRGQSTNRNQGAHVSRGDSRHSKRKPRTLHLGPNHAFTRGNPSPPGVAQRRLVQDVDVPSAGKLFLSQTPHHLEVLQKTKKNDMPKLRINACRKSSRSGHACTRQRKGRDHWTAFLSRQVLMISPSKTKRTQT